MAKRRPAGKKPSHLYTLDRMPRVDIHVHIGDPKENGRLIRIMNQAGIAVVVNLSGKMEMVEQMAEVHRKWKGRILLAPGQYRTGRTLWWSMKDLERFKEAGCAGTKIHCHYTRGLGSKSNIAKIRRQGELGLPVIGLHIADPYRPGYWRPTYWDCIREAADVIAACPATTFIMAHGFWLMTHDEGLAALAEYFDRYPNLNADLSACFQWWDPPEPTHDKLRAFVVRYQDRLLYGTDGSPGYSRKRHYRNTYTILETRGEHLHGFFTPRKAHTWIKGLGLSKDALNRIYWANAARLVPRVRESLAGLGYDV